MVSDSIFHGAVITNSKCVFPCLSAEIVFCYSGFDFTISCCPGDFTVEDHSSFQKQEACNVKKYVSDAS